jgi:hypothetical protein
MVIVGIFGGILLLTAIAMVVLWITRGPGSSNPLPVIIAAVVMSGAFITASVSAVRRLAGDVTTDNLATIPAHAFAITPTAIEFPATRFQPAATWDRDRAVATVVGSGWTRRLVLRYQGQHTRRYFAWVTVDSPEVLAARISRGGHPSNSGDGQ